MMDVLGISFKGVNSCRRLEWGSKAGSERHRIIHIATGHEQEGFLELIGAKVR